MSLAPAFEIGVWNAWIFILLMFLTYIPAQLINKEALNKVNEGWASEQWARTDKFLANATHVIIIPLTTIYSVFLVAGINIATTLLDKEPITKGVYRFSRHPAYFGGFLLYLGIGIASASWVFILLASAWIIMWHISVPSEERFLLKKYGTAYREYMSKTPRWIGIPKSRK
jgi:isoprenylcysteine carboxyl methyltransferase (ICMT) family protein YpbQ